MFEYLLVLKGTNKELASFEFENLFYLYYNKKIELKQIENTFFYFKSNIDLFKNPEVDIFTSRLTFTNKIYKLLQSSNNLEEFYNDVLNINLNEFKNKSFRAEIKIISNKLRNKKIDYDLYLKPIWSKFKNPIVDLKKPEIEFFFLDNEKDIFGKKLRFGIKLFENKKNYLKRMPKLRPIKKPYTLKSDMARASINYLDIKNGIILDPFSGIGGILLEAYDMGFEIIGNDINYNDLNHMKTNFDYFFPNNNDIKITRSCADSKTQFLKENSIDGIVTDIPYGKSSRLLGIDLYEGFLKSAKNYLKPNRRLVVIYANFTPFKELALKYFKEIIEIEEYINKSMTRYILVLENKK